jgi:hypothetical protein
MELIFHGIRGYIEPMQASAVSPWKKDENPTEIIKPALSRRIWIIGSGLRMD